MTSSITHKDNIIVKVTTGSGFASETGANLLTNLQDVNIINPQQDQVLMYNFSSLKFENKLLNMDFGEY